MNVIRADESADVIPYEVVFESYNAYLLNLLAILGVRNEQDREDLAQEVFKDFARVSERTPENHVKNWLTRKARHHVINFIRRKKALMRLPSNMRIPLDEVMQIDPSAPTSEEIAIAREASAKIYEALSTLPQEDREIFLLQYEEGLPTKDIAELCSTTDAAVRMRLFRVREKMRVVLGELAS